MSVVKQKWKIALDPKTKLNPEDKLSFYEGRIEDLTTKLTLRERRLITRWMDKSATLKSEPDSQSLSWWDKICAERIESKANAMPSDHSIPWYKDIYGSVDKVIVRLYTAFKYHTWTNLK